MDSFLPHDPAAFTTPGATGPPTLPAGLRVADFTLIRVLGQGGMATVYEAQQDYPVRRVALKVIARLAGMSPQQSRFSDEVSFAGKLHHPAIAQVYQAGVHVHEGVYFHYCAMELVESAETVTAFAEGLSLRKRLLLCIEVAEAVAHAHEKGILHRDIKPSNVLVDGAGRVKVIDFGIARSLTETSGHGLTETGTFVGTLAYTSPEQCRGRSSPDERSDLYALGVLAYEVICGSLPYDVSGVGPADAFGVIESAAPRRPREIDPQLPSDLERVLLTALAKDPSQRYARVRDFAEDLHRVLTDRPIAGSPQTIRQRIVRDARRAFTRHGFVTISLIAILAYLGSLQLSQVVDNRGPNRLFERWATTRLDGIPDVPLRDVRVVSFGSDEEIESAARSAGLEAVRVENLQSIRALHGAMMRHISEAGATVIAFDIQFNGSSLFDPAFVAGVSAVETAGTRVIAASGRPSEGRNQISPLIRSVVALGTITATDPERSAWALYTVTQTSQIHPATPSLAAATAAAFRTGHRDHHWRIAQTAVVYSTDGGETGEFPVTVVLETPPAGSGERQTRPIVAFTMIEMPKDSILEQATVPYERVMCAESAQLREWFSGRIVLIGDARPGRDGPYRTSDGREFCGVYANAVAIQQMLDGRVVRRPGYLSMAGATINRRTVIEFLSGLGGAVAAVLVRRPRWITATVVAAPMLAFLGSIALYKSRAILMGPLVPAVVFLSVFLVCAFLLKVRGRMLLSGLGR